VRERKPTVFEENASQRLGQGKAFVIGLRKKSEENKKLTYNLVYQNKFDFERNLYIFDFSHLFALRLRLFHIVDVKEAEAQALRFSPKATMTKRI
jgi:hypothetical protein